MGYYTVFCAKCEKVSPNTVEYCFNCGTELNTSENIETINKKLSKYYINYKSIIIGLIILSVCYFISLTFFEQYSGFTAIIAGFLVYIQLNHMTKNYKIHEPKKLIEIFLYKQYLWP